MHSGLNKFMAKVNNGEAGSVASILCIKNGFNKILDWKNTDDANYCDIRLYVLIKDSETKSRMIGQIEFAMNWLLAAKKMGYVSR